MLFYSNTIFEIIYLGKMGENKTFNFELKHPAAPFCTIHSLPSDPKQEINSNLSGKIAEFINDLPYEKTKAQRILAKTIPTNTDHQHIGKRYNWY